jgi:proteic killer suppression protein
MIRSIKDRRIQAILDGRAPKGFPADLVRAAQRKLQMLDAARTLNDLRTPYANRLEALKEDRKGQHAIRINDQWRLVFRWQGDGAEQVEIIDYH